VQVPPGHMKTQPFDATLLTLNELPYQRAQTNADL
jgi:hypothetical protein